jgi:hypothetical protein
MQDVHVILNPGLPWQTQHLTGRLFTSKFDLNLRKKLVKYYIYSIAFYAAETWTLQKADDKYFGSFQMWHWRRMENTSWLVRVRNKEM